MSEDLNAANVADPVANVSDGNKPVDAEAKKVDSSAERILKESKEWKQKYQQVQAKLDEVTKVKMVQEGDLKGALEMATQKIEALEKKNRLTKIQTAVAFAAAKAGCVKPEAAWKLGNPEFLDYNSDEESVSGVESFIEDLKKSDPYLFQVAKPPMVNAATPGGSANKKLTHADIAKLPLDKQAPYWAKALSSK